MTSFIAAGGSGRSTSVIPAVPAALSVTTIALIRDLPVSSARPSVRGGDESGDRDDCLHLDRHPKRQFTGTDRRAGVAPRVAPERQDQVAEAVDRSRRDVEPVRALDEPQRLDPTGHAVEVSELLLERGEY